MPLFGHCIYRALKPSLSIFILLVFFTHSVFASTFTVDNNGDGSDGNLGDGTCATAAPGNCTFRAAVEEANAFAGTHTINFSGNFTITKTGGSYALTSNSLNIDGATNTINIDANNTLGVVIDITGDSITVQDVNVYGANGTGISVGTTADGTTLDSNFIGVDGAEAVDGNTNGINVQGTDTTITDNVISGNTAAGILINGGSDVLITGNKIGTDSAGTTAKANGTSGILVDDGGSGGDFGTVTIGGDTAQEENVISGNTANGIFIDGETNLDGTFKIMGNLIGVDATGATAMANGGDGILATGPIGDTIILIGIDDDGVGDINEGNVISGNTGDGVQIDDAATLDIAGNYIGVGENGTTVVGNGGDGLKVDATILRIGSDLDGTADANEGNVIGNNGANGVNITGTDVTTATIHGNNIGVDSTGANDRGNTIDGIEISAANLATLTIGSTTTGGRNVIGHNTIGIDISDIAEAATTTITNNYIGVEGGGSTAAANSGVGIDLNDGGAATIDGNVIANSGSFGLSVTDATGLTFRGNKVGTTSAGTTAAGNGSDGIRLNASNLASVTIGGATSSLSNVIAASTGIGLNILQLAAATTAVSILGNYIGIASDGLTTTSMANTSDGIRATYGDLTIGGENSLIASGDLNSGNIISNNGGNGIHLIGGNVDEVDVFGNIIGLKKDGSGDYNTDAGNTENGIEVADSNVDAVNIGESDGASTEAKRNIISGNDFDGIYINDTADGTTTVSILNNYIGTDITGASAVANSREGIDIADGDTIDIGGTAANKGNLISGNTEDGVQISIGGDVDIDGNTIGLNAAGTAALANADSGIRVDGGTVAIGAGVSGGRNVISGNGEAGLYLSGGTVTVNGNYIGTSADGESAIGNGAGVYASGVLNFGGILIDDGTNTIGSDKSDANKRNVISGNSGQGVAIIKATGTTVAGNFIGTDKDGDIDLGNVDGSDSNSKINGSGIVTFDLVGVVNGTVIGGAAVNNGNVISGNDGHGIAVVHPSGGANTQDWSAGSIKNNLIVVQVDGSTPLGNGDSNILVDSNNSAAITGLSIGGSKNIICNSTGCSKGIVVQDVTLGNASTLETDNTATDTSSSPAFRFFEIYVNGVLTDFEPPDVVTADPEPEATGGGGGSVSVGLQNVQTAQTAPDTDPEPEPVEDVVEVVVEEELPSSEPEEVEVSAFVEEVLEITDVVEIEDLLLVEAVEPVTISISPVTDFVLEAVSELLGEQPVLSLEIDQFDDLIEEYEERKDLEVDRPRSEDAELVENAMIEGVSDVAVFESVISDIYGDSISRELSLGVNGGVMLHLGADEIIDVGVDDLDGLEFIFDNENPGQLIEEDGKLRLTFDESSDFDNDGICDLCAMVIDVPIFDSDPDGDGIKTVDEIFLGLNPVLADQIPDKPRVTNFDAVYSGIEQLIIGSNPSIRLSGIPGEEVSVFFVDAAIEDPGEEDFIFIGTTVIDDFGKGEVSNEDLDLLSGEYIVFAQAENGEIGELSKITVDASLENKTPTAEIVDGKLIGQAEPGTMLFVTWKSVILSSIVLSDAGQGTYTIDIPDDLDIGEHQVVVYAFSIRDKYLSSFSKRKVLREAA